MKQEDIKFIEGLRGNSDFKETLKDYIESDSELVNMLGMATKNDCLYLIMAEESNFIKFPIESIPKLIQTIIRAAMLDLSFKADVKFLDDDLIDKIVMALKEVRTKHENEAESAVKH